MRLAFLVPSLLEIACKRILDAAHPGSYTQKDGYSESEIPIWNWIIMAFFPPIHIYSVP